VSGLKCGERRGATVGDRDESRGSIGSRDLRNELDGCRQKKDGDARKS